MFSQDGRGLVLSPQGDYGPMTSRSALIRRLNDYGFKKTRGVNMWFHPGWDRDAPLLSVITRSQRPSPKSSPSSSPSPSNNTNKVAGKKRKRGAPGGKDVAALEAQVADVRQSYADLQSKRSELKTLVASKRQKLLGIEAEQTRLRLEFDNVVGVVAGMKAQLDALMVQVLQ